MIRHLISSLPLIANLAYAGFHLLLSILNHTAWFAIFAVYYFILAPNPIGSGNGGERAPARRCFFCCTLF